MINKDKKDKATFELVLITRDANGNPTGTKSVLSDKASKIEEFWTRHQGKVNKNKRSDAKLKKGEVKQIKTTEGLAAYIDTTERELIVETDAQGREAE